MLKTRAKYHLGQVVKHRKHPFRGVVFDVDAMFANTDEWYEAIPEEARPQKDQPFYHLLAENDQSYYVAYVSEQNLVADYSGQPVDHPDKRFSSIYTHTQTHTRTECQAISLSKLE